jgi:hypothetical protein
MKSWQFFKIGKMRLMRNTPNNGLLRAGRVSIVAPQDNIRNSQ